MCHQIDCFLLIYLHQKVWQLYICVTHFHAVNSSEIFITSPVISDKKPKAKARQKEISRIIEDFNRTLDEVKFTEGIITSRFDYTNPSGWKTNIFRNAFKI